MGARRVAIVGAVLGAVALACSGAGTSQSPIPQYPTGELACLVTLSSYCCDGTGAHSCIADFASAERCSAWPSGTSLTVFATPCQGMTAVRIQTSYQSFYVYDANGKLKAIGDNATTPDPRAGAISCGAGPSAFVVPSACATVWESATLGSGCAAGPASAGSVCP